MQEKDYSKLLEHVERIVKTKNQELIISFKRYCNTYLVHFVPTEIYEEVIKKLER